MENPFDNDEEWVRRPIPPACLGYGIEDENRLLSEGIAKGGKPPRLPMPPFRMTREDAEAVATYP